MDKKAVMYAVGAMIIILIVALVIKPIATGQPLNLGLPGAVTPNPTYPVTTPDNGVTHVVIPATSVSTPPPTPVPTWDINRKINVSFVSPSSYGISLNQSLPNGTRIDSAGRNTSRITYATISGQYSATTQVMHIPFPYWEIWYTIEPTGKMGGMDQKLGSSIVKGVEGVSHSFVQGSFSVTNPLFTLQVMDAADPNRIVRTITPPGGLDSTLWTGSDPRPWKEKFYEGQKDYFFIISTQALSSYTIEIRVPAEYSGKY